ncbi:MAG: M61 family peptidase [Candidatus Eremiobacteraeota bacterium]|nr:M61 family peptidase [Candidatus Eremiobacteraeota bacterium]
MRSEVGLAALAVAAMATIGAHRGIAADDFANPSATAYAARANPQRLVLDARDAARGVMYSHMAIPVRSGPVTLLYPKWIPGEHGPTGPLNDLAAIRFTAGGHALPWRRDTVDLYAFHVDVPSGVDTLDVDVDILLNAPGDTMATKNVAIVNWNRDVFYQANTNSHDDYVDASILLPEGWGYASAMPLEKRSGSRVDFSTVSLATLVDSPLDLGRYFKHIALWSNGASTQYLDVFADHPQDLDFPVKLLAPYKQMTPQALALYGARHWNDYHSLLTLSDAIGFQGIEHHQSSDDRAPADYMTNAQSQMASGDLLTHEFSHSWNGKYRRPADLTTPNFSVPMQTDLLWVYEGMNQYLGDLLSFRTGIRQPKTYPEYLANIFAEMDSEPGRATEPLIDTTTAAPYLYEARGDYSSLRRTAGDFYTEGELIWLDVDTILREQTGGKRSLDDFLHLFAGPPDTGPMTVTYTRDDVERLLHQIAPYDWHAFFQRRVYEIADRAPLDELRRAGYTLVYNATPNAFMEASEASNKSINAWYSLGINFNHAGIISDVRDGSPAWKAGLAPGMEVAAVDGQAFSGDVLAYALKTAQRGQSPITLLAKHGDWFATYDLNYHQGPRYPHLARISGVPDMLAKIMAPR